MNDPQLEGHMASRIGRRDFVTLLVGTAAALAPCGAGSEPAMPVIGFGSQFRRRGQLDQLN
jgi:hypothetical protein